MQRHHPVGRGDDSSGRNGCDRQPSLILQSLRSAFGYQLSAGFQLTAIGCQEALAESGEPITES
jgi:hypothetical protein